MLQEEEEDDLQAPSTVKTRTKGRNETKRKSASRKDSEDQDEDENLQAIVLNKEVHQLFENFLTEELSDTTVLHNILRVQYFQCYSMAIHLLLSSFGKVEPLPWFAGTRPLVRGITGCIGLSQGFSLTAAAQTTHTPMKKSLQYNMLFHMLFAFIVIVHNDPEVVNGLQFPVGFSILNVALNMWACYFHEVPNPVEDEDEEDDEED